MKFDFVKLPTMKVVAPDHKALFEIVSTGPTYVKATTAEVMNFRGWILNNQPGLGLGHRSVDGGHLIFITVPRKRAPKARQ